MTAVRQILKVYNLPPDYEWDYPQPPPKAPPDEIPFVVTVSVDVNVPCDCGVTFRFEAEASIGHDGKAIFWDVECPDCAALHTLEVERNEARP